MPYRKSLTSWSIRNKLLLLILTAFLPGAGIIVHDGIEDRREQLEAASRDAVLMVESLSAQQEKIAVGTKQMLSTLAQLPQVQSLEAEACNKLFRELIDQNPIYSGMGLATPNGNLFANAKPFEPGSVNISDQKHVRDAIESLDFSVGEYVVGRLSTIPAIYYGYPVLDSDKRLMAIVAVGFRLTEFDSFIKKASLPPDSAVVILDHRGLRLHRFPENDASPLGQAPKDGLEQTKALDAGIYERMSDDGVYRIFAFKRLRLNESSSPYLLIMVGVPKDKILQKANLAMSYNLLILGLTAIIAVSLAWFLGNFTFTRPINQLVNAAQRFGSGEMKARTDLPHTHDELGKLAQSFDSMADLLEQRNLEGKEAEEELRSVYRQNQLILNAAGEGIVGLDENGTITFANPAAQDMLGYDEMELIGKDLHETAHHSFPDGTRYPVTDCPMFQSLRSAASSRVRDEVLWRKDGTNFPTAYSSTPIMENGQVVGAVVTFRDISVRKRAEEDLKRANRYLENVFESSPEAIGIVDKSGRLIKWNRIAEELYGKAFEGLRGMSSFDLYADKEKLERMLTQLRREGSVSRWEMMMKRGDGSIVPFEVSIGLLQDSENRTLGSVAVTRDLSEIKETLAALRTSNDQLNQEMIERKRSEESLRKSEAKYRLLAENGTDMIWMMGLDGVFTYHSPAVMELRGYTPEEANALSLEQTLCPESFSYFQRMFKEEDEKPMAQRWSDRVLELQMLRKDGNVIWVESTIRAVRETDGALIGLQGSTRDISERKRTEEERKMLEVQLRQAQKLEAIGTLAGGIAHDFNNVLTAILGYTEMVLDEIPEGSHVRHHLDQVLKGAHRAKTLVHQILAFSRKNDEQELRPVAISTILREALKLLRAALPATIELKQYISNEPGAVLADPTQLHQVFMNLCTNAAHAMREKGGTLEVRLESAELDKPMASTCGDLKEGVYVRLTVKDTGQGMDADTLERIFDPYFTTKEMGEGTGLGLAVVHGIVKSHGGAIAVQSEPGKGTVFEILFPRTEIGREKPDQTLEPVPRGTEHILFVDDESALTDLGQTMLSQLGYKVTTKMSSLEALELFRSQPDAFDLVITDYTMPQMTGAGLAIEMLRIRADIPIVLCTGFSNMISEEKAKEIGICAFIMKPLIRRNLAEVIRRVLDEKATRLAGQS